MSVIDPAVLRAMAAAGASTEVIIAAVEAAQQADLERAARKRAGNAERQRRHKAKKRDEVTQGNAGNALPSVIRVTSVTSAPSPNKAPQTPKINPTPHGCNAGTRERTCEGSIPGHRLPDLLVLTAWAYCASLGAARQTALAALWGGTPPPPGVSDECWTGFLAHRKAMPKAGKFTPRAYKLLCEKLAKLATDEWPPGRLLDEAIDRNWITVFPPPKDSPNDRRHPAGKTHRPGTGSRPDGFFAALREARDSLAGAGGADEP